MNEVVREYVDRQIHMILDNLRTYKPKDDQWLARHKNIHFHYTPTHALWMNQVEVWFSILTHKALKKASFISTEQVRKTNDALRKPTTCKLLPLNGNK